MLRVKDSGPGLPIEVRRRLAEAPGQGPTRLGAEKGQGLGICRLLVHANNGQISAEDESEGGVIAVRLPLADVG